MCNAPGLEIVAPSNAADVYGLTRSAFASNNPTVIVSHARLLGLETERGNAKATVPIGLADVKRRGRDATIVANSLMTHYALLAAEQLAAEGIEAEVVDLRSLSPLDEKTILDSVGRTGRLVVVDECPLRCGIASEIAAVVAEHGFGLLQAPIARVTRAQVPVPYSPPLEAAITPDAGKIAAAVRKVTKTRLKTL
jgi:pyruvate dehydrogenase E1 component beta subunit